MKDSKNLLFDSNLFRTDSTGKSIAFFSIKKPIAVNKDLINELKENWLLSPDKNLRICLHDSPSSLFHEMVILETQGKYYRPHKHMNKGESYHIIEGKLGIVNFNDCGDITDARILDPFNDYLYRLGESV